MRLCFELFGINYQNDQFYKTSSTTNLQSESSFIECLTVSNHMQRFSYSMAFSLQLSEESKVSWIIYNIETFLIDIWTGTHRSSYWLITSCDSLVCLPRASLNWCWHTQWLPPSNHLSWFVHNMPYQLVLDLICAGYTRSEPRPSLIRYVFA